MWRVSTPAVPARTHGVPRLGSTAARLKLKGIDGGPHKQRSVWFNSMRRAEPYQGLKSTVQHLKGCARKGKWTGAAWLSSARAVRCWVKSRNERNPRPVLLTGKAEDSRGTAGAKPEEGGDDVKSSWSLRPGLHTCYNGRYSGLRQGNLEPIPESRPQCGLEAATRLHEAGIASNRGSATPR